MKYAIINTETTGLEFGFHEICGISLLHIDPEELVVKNKFTSGVRPRYPKRASSESLKVNGFTVEKLMSSPPVVVSPDTKIEDAIKLMGAKKIRRLPGVRNGKLIGMATERDLLQISPLLLDVVRELAAVTQMRESQYPRKRFSSGKCEDCGMLSGMLTEINGRLLCESCSEAYK